jgi:hypothetical protein
MSLEELEVQWLPQLLENKVTLSSPDSVQRMLK